MPNTGYHVDENNQDLYFIDTDAQPYHITVPKGNYNALTLRDALNYKFATYTSVDYIQCAYNQLTNKYTFTSTDTGLNYFTFYGDSSIMKVLGFEINVMFKVHYILIHH